MTSAAHNYWDDSALVATLRAKLAAVTNPDLSPVLADIGEIGQLDSIQRIQSTKTAPDGSAWAPWSARYAKSGRGRSLERRSGDLMGKVDYFVSGSDEVTLTAELPYAARQQFGFHGTDSLGRKVNHPARPYLGLSDVATRDVGTVVANHIVRVFNEAA